jgi:hypothetical protein
LIPIWLTLITFFTFFSCCIPNRLLYCTRNTHFYCLIPYWRCCITLFAYMFDFIPNRFTRVTFLMGTTIRCFIINFVILTLSDTFLLLEWVIFIFRTVFGDRRTFNFNNIPFLPKWTIFFHTFTCSIIEYWIFEWALFTYLLCLIPKRSFLRAQLAWKCIWIPYWFNIITYLCFYFFWLAFIKLNIVVFLISTF